MRRVIAALTLLSLLLFTTACHAETPVSRTGFALDTVVSVTLYECEDGVDREALLNSCFVEIERLEKLLSVTVENSDISRINAAIGQAVTVSPETAELLKLSVKYGELSEGAFDVTLRPVTALWDFTEKVIPESNVLASAVQTVDYRQLHVEGTTVTLTGGALDLGGIAKGYIADRIRDLLIEGGAISALIDLGGNIVVCGQKEGGDWRVGIKDPNDVSELCAVVTGCDMSVVTSGTYERGFTENGVNYHHLLSPETGMPVQNGLSSVSIVCGTSTEADALSTACFVMGEEKGMALIESLHDVQALFVRTDGTVIASSGLSYTIA